jgi:hypothetical protein
MSILMHNFKLIYHGKNLYFTGVRNGFTTLLLNEMRENGISPLPQTFHCIIHQENLCAKTLEFQNLMSVINNIVKDIRRKGLKHRQFRKFLEDIDSEYEDVPYHAEVRWVSRGRMMNRVYDLKDVITEFYRAQGSDIEEFNDEQFINDFAFAVDIISQLNSLNTGLQGNSNVIADLYHHVGGFSGKLGIWMDQFMDGELDSDSFPHLFSREDMNLKLDSYSQLLGKLRDEFEARFADFKKHSDDLCMFTAPLSVSTVPTRLSIEVMDLKHDLVYSPLFTPGSDIVKAYQSLPLRYSRLRGFAAKWLAMFGSTYRCEKLFSTMKYAKNKFRSRLTDEHLRDILVISDSDIEPDFDALMKDMDQFQKSH